MPQYVNECKYTKNNVKEAFRAMTRAVDSKILLCSAAAVGGLVLWWWLGLVYVGILFALPPVILYIWKIFFPVISANNYEKQCLKQYGTQYITVKSEFFTDSAVFVTYESGNSVTKKYSDIEKFTETQNLYVLEFKNADMRLIAKDGFTQGDEGSFGEFLQGTRDS